jgi:hypothetical protein
MGDWAERLSVTWLTVAVFAATYVVTAVIHLVVTRLAVGDRARAFKTVSAGLLPPLGILFGLFVAFIAAQVWSEIDRANSAVNNEASALSRVVFLAASFPGEPETRLRGLVRRHIDNVAEVEWPMLARRKATLKITPHELGEALQLILAERGSDDRATRDCHRAATGARRAPATDCRQPVAGQSGQMGGAPGAGDLHPCRDRLCPRRQPARLRTLYGNLFDRGCRIGAADRHP